MHLSIVFLNFPKLIAPILTLEGIDFIKITILFTGTLIITFFVVRTIFRYSLYGYLSSVIMQITKEDVEKARNLNYKKGILVNKLYALHTATWQNLYKNNKIFFFSASYFVSVGDRYENYPNRENRGVCVCFGLSVLITLLLLLFLW